jgi:hypothetical protein
MTIVHLWRGIFLGSVALALGACAHPPARKAGTAPQCFSVSFPNVTLAASEYIESVEVVVRCGRIESIKRLLDDWDLKVEWDNPDLLKLNMIARHFSTGLPNTDQLKEFIIVRESADNGCYNAVGKPGMNITATLLTQKTDPAGGGERKYEFSQTDLILKPVCRKEKQ